MMLQPGNFFCFLHRFEGLSLINIVDVWRCDFQALFLDELVSVCCGDRYRVISRPGK